MLDHNTLLIGVVASALPGRRQKYEAARFPSSSVACEGLHRESGLEQAEIGLGQLHPPARAQARGQSVPPAGGLCLRLSRRFYFFIPSTDGR